MVRFSNPPVAEGINSARESSGFLYILKVFGIFILVLGLCILVIGGVAHYFAAKIPFSWEQEMSEGMMMMEDSGTEEELYLRSLSSKLELFMGFEEGMSVRVHYIDDDFGNAFATLGGNIFVFRGLLERLEHEEAVALLLAHEMAHVQHRDVIRASVRSLVVMFFLSIVGIDFRIGEDLSTLGGLSFSRAQETRADERALEAVYFMYGRIGESLSLFEVLEQIAEEEQGLELPEILSSHPDTADRVEHLRKLADEKGWKY